MSDEFVANSSTVILFNLLHSAGSAAPRWESATRPSVRAATSSSTETFAVPFLALLRATGALNRNEGGLGEPNTKRRKVARIELTRTRRRFQPP